MAKKGQKQKKYSAEFKIGVIMDMREHHLGYRETARKYKLAVTHESSAANMVQRWERIYLEEGAEGLMKEKRERPRYFAGSRRGRPPKLDKNIEKDLIEGKSTFKNGDRILKKLRALVLEEEQKKNKKQ